MRAADKSQTKSQGVSQDTGPPLTPRQGLDYRGRVPDANPQHKPKFLWYRTCSVGILLKNEPYYREKNPGVQEKVAKIQILLVSP